MMFPGFWWIIAAATAVVCLLGFYRFVWFLSVGYGLSVSAIGITIAILGFATNSFVFPDCIPYLVLLLIIIAYGVRLGGFLLVRELKNKNYQKKLKEASGDKPVPIFVKIFMWIILVFLYYAQTSAAFYRFSNGLSNTLTDVCLYVGIAVALLGVIIESVADKQKSAQKQINPNMCATKGLYKICRCPNYFGEMTFWTGLFISGISVCQGWQWLIMALGYVCIIYIMFSGAKRVEARHIKYYGSTKEYQEYANKTPILLPLIPVYHLVKENKNEK